jgi:hypothetical protein
LVAALSTLDRLGLRVARWVYGMTRQRVFALRSKIVQNPCSDGAGKLVAPSKLNAGLPSLARSGRPCGNELVEAGEEGLQHRRRIVRPVADGLVDGEWFAL